MKKSRLKSYFLNFFTLFVSTIICLLIVNVIFINISNQKYFPRALANSLSNILLTFYPATYNKKDLKVYDAILGDSYSQGAGDAYLSGEEDFTLGHHLHKKNKENYLNFGRGGYGSISAVSNLILINKLSNLPNLIEDLEKPRSIIFIFYEGNDLEENIFEYNQLKKSDESIADFVIRRIEENIELNKVDRIINIFPILVFIKKIYSHFIWHMDNLLSKISQSDNLKESLSHINNRIKKLFGHTVVLNKPEINSITFINSIKEHNIHEVQPLQSAAVILPKKDILIAIEIFNESIKYIKSWSQVENIFVLYIPSPITLYDWKEPITYEFKNPINGAINEIKQTTNKKNNLNSVFIRNKIKEFSKENKFIFLDTSDFLVQKGKDKILHGPLDWRHFNYDGYKTVSNFLIKNIINN